MPFFNRRFSCGDYAGIRRKGKLTAEQVLQAREPDLI